ncbi:hypothetical protein D3C76_112760 [compost metagenome]
MFSGIRVSVDKLPKETGRIVVMMPSLLHVKALQFLLKDKLSQDPPIRYAEFMEDPDKFPDKARLIFLQTDNPNLGWKSMTPKAMFMADEVFALVGKALIPSRDQTGYRWGDQEKGILSVDVFVNYWEAYNHVNR